ncbi:glycosyltransferase family 4 protein [Roseiconus lacunae]|uniref:glycosyltransferase family 4 protein n=1 Tax=Roseiconus lacunae TaxID=2605694 RepID=UPI00308B09E7|nr:glycosyltransferase family 4 protein [Stieleria sp. HD01]
MNSSESNQSHENGYPKQRPKLFQVITSPMSANILLRGQLAYMREAGFDVTVISAPGDLLDQTAERERVSTIGLEMDRNPNPYKDIVALLKLIRILRRHSPDIIHYSTPKAGFIGSIAARIAGVPIRIYTLRGMRADGLRGFAASALLAMEKVACRFSHFTICVSQSLRERAVELELDRPEKLFVLTPQSSNGIDVARFSRTADTAEQAMRLRKTLGLPDNTKVIGFVGRFSADKGSQELAEAFIELRKTHTDLRLLCIGPNEANSDLPEWVSKLIQSDPNVFSTGMLANPVPAYELIDVLVLPTYREGFPNVVLEAAAMGIPVVATNVTGCTDAVVDGATGSLVEPKDSIALASAIERYLTSEPLRKAHGDAARNRATNDFQPQAVWNSLLTTYRAALAKKSSFDV